MKEFGYEEIEAATQNFSPTNLIAKGSHGCVYKGVLKNGTFVAIKKQSLGLQKLQDNTKLDNEVRILSSFPQNPYLINLLGTSHDSVNNNNKVLVMEHMPNGTLHDLLHLAPTPPTWPKRVEIAIQIARSLQFLHESNPLVIHRDIKSENILFDSSWNAKLADFGLAIQMTNNLLSQRVDSVSRPAGTIGYLDPCYTSPSKLSTKIDVFSFGVVLLEIMTCTRAINFSRVPASIVEWSMLLIKKGRILDICDKRVALPRYMEGTIEHILSIAARCVSSKENFRPKVSEIISEMENCIFEPIQFPIWMKYFLPRVILVKRQRKLGAKRYNATTTTVCAAQEASGHVDISSRKLLLREILADVTLN